MQISKDAVVTFHYTLLDDQQQELESSHSGDPVAYLHGHGNIIAGLESAMQGREAGDEFETTVAPAQGYGERQENAVQRVPIKHLLGDKRQLTRLKPGQVVSINTENGARQVMVVKAGKFNIDVDVNHPLAGKTLTFKVSVQEVRAATAEEVAHGHAHGVGGHQH